jgi:hypothetical protein
MPQGSRNVHLIATLLAALLPLVSACGGGGDEDGSGGNAPPVSFTLSGSTLNFVDNGSGAFVPAQTVTATINGLAQDTPVYFKTVVTGTALESVGPFFRGALPTIFESQVRAVSPFGPGPGTYTAAITVTACTSDRDCLAGVIGTPQTINVTYTINFAVLSPWPTSLGFQIYPNMLDPEFVRTLQFIANPPWSISSSFGGISVSPASGTTNRGTLTVTLDRAAVAALPVEVTEAQLTFSSPGNAPIVVPVVIDVHRPRALYAAPRVQVSGGSGEFTTFLRGADLMASGDYLGARYGDVPEIRGANFDATRYYSFRSALAAGTYPIRLLTAAGLDVAQPNLKIIVVDPLALPARFIQYPADGRTRRVSDLFYDAETQAIVLGVQYPAGSEADSQILRYTWNGSWSAAGTRNQPYLAALAPRVDGGWLATALINDGSDDALVKCNQDFTACTNSQVNSAATSRRTAIGMTNDGQPLIFVRPRGNPAAAGSLHRYSLHKDAFFPLDSGAVHDVIAVASDDGTRVAIGSRVLSVAGVPVESLMLWNSLTPMFTGAVSTTAVNRLAIDGSATRVIVNGNQVYETSVMQRIGTLPASTLAAALNRSGTRAYTWDSNGTVRIFDVQSLPVPAGSAFTDIAPAIVPAGNPGAGTDGLSMRMAVSPDEATLFMAGSAGIAVVPVAGL